MASMAVATTIIKQMGGTVRLGLMIGAHDFVGDCESVQFGFKGSRKANKCRIILEPTDTYRLELWKYSKRTFQAELASEFDGLYWDALKPTFESETGLYLSL